ncbi:MAG: hypothetical protein R2688_05905 [Fimbriimonadaceae bacterium]|nr:hypothetical protein [Armatimonadota bacterium]
MDLILGRLGLNGSSIKLAYLLGRDTGRKFLRGALIFPGIRIADLRKVAEKQDAPIEELIAKRDHMLDGMIDFLEEMLDLDDD